jgi:hypothetical protein
MEKNIFKYLIIENGRLLKKTTTTTINIPVFKDRAQVNIEKIFKGNNSKGKPIYRYIVHSYFTYNDRQGESYMYYTSLKRALTYARISFEQRNSYMERHNYQLKEATI